jgi:hypothetical protein
MSILSLYRLFLSPRRVLACPLLLLLLILTTLPALTQSNGMPQQQQASGAASNANAALEKLAAMELDALDFAEEGFDWRHDWWKYLLLLFASLLALFLFLLLAGMLFSLVLSLACLMISLIGSALLAPMFHARLEQQLSAPLFGVLTAQHLALALSFVLCYLVTSLIMRLAYTPKSQRKK